MNRICSSFSFFTFFPFTWIFISRLDSSWGKCGLKKLHLFFLKKFVRFSNKNHDDIMATIVGWLVTIDVKKSYMEKGK